MKFTLDYIENESRKVYAGMQERGLRMDEARLQQLINDLTQELSENQLKLNRILGRTIRPNSAKEVKEVLEARGVKVPTTPKGNPSVTKEFLASLEQTEVVVALSLARLAQYKLSAAEGVQSRVKNGRAFPEWKFEPELGRPHMGGGINAMNWW